MAKVVPLYNFYPRFCTTLVVLWTSRDVCGHTQVILRESYFFRILCVLGSLPPPPPQYRRFSPPPPPENTPPIPLRTKSPQSHAQQGIQRIEPIRIRVPIRRRTAPPACQHLTKNAESPSGCGSQVDKKTEPRRNQGFFVKK